MVSQLPLLLLLLLCPLGGHGCHGPDVDRELILAKVRALFLDALGPPPLTGEGEVPAVRRLPRRHALGSFSRRNSEPEEEDVSQAILFPTTGNWGGALGGCLGLGTRWTWTPSPALPPQLALQQGASCHLRHGGDHSYLLGWRNTVAYGKCLGDTELRPLPALLLPASACGVSPR